MLRIFSDSGWKVKRADKLVALAGLSRKITGKPGGSLNLT